MKNDYKVYVLTKEKEKEERKKKKKIKNAFGSRDSNLWENWSSLFEFLFHQRSPLQRGICIDSSKEPEYLLDLRGFRRIDVVKIQGECKSIIAFKIEEHQFGCKAIESNIKLFKN